MAFENLPLEAQAPKRRLYGIVALVLRVGLVVSLTLMAVGLVILGIQGKPLPLESIPPGEAVARAFRLDPSASLDLGILTLLATPVSYVVVSLAEFVAERDWRFTSVTVLVIAILALSVVFATHV